ncbi:MAG: PIN domain-containing protein [Geodermatophilaceae bacterium]
MRGWLLDNSAASRASDPRVGQQLAELAGALFLCPVGELEQLYASRSAADYDRDKEQLRGSLEIVAAPGDVLDRALQLQRDLAHHHGMWHRTPIRDLLIAETAIHHGLGIVHVDRDFNRISEVRPLTARRLS